MRLVSSLPRKRHPRSEYNLWQVGIKLPHSIDYQINMSKYYLTLLRNSQWFWLDSVCAVDTSIKFQPLSVLPSVSQAFTLTLTAVSSWDIILLMCSLEVHFHRGHTLPTTEQLSLGICSVFSQVFYSRMQRLRQTLKEATCEIWDHKYYNYESF